MVGLVAPAEVRGFFARERFPEAASGIRKGLEMLQIEEAIARRANVVASSPPTPR